MTTYGTAAGILDDMKRAVRRWTAARQQAIASHGLLPFEFETLQVLANAGEGVGVSPSQIAAELVMSPAAITGRLDSLEEHGFLTRLPVPGDRRKVTVELSEKGRTVWATAHRHVSLFDQRITEQLDPGEQQAISSMIRRMESTMTFQNQGTDADSR